MGLGLRWFLLIIILPCNWFASAASAESVATSTTATYARSGFRIEYTFSCTGGCRTGKFANGWDIWVAPVVKGSDVTILSITPDQVGEGMDLVNGAVADILSMAGGQGWTGQHDYEPALTIELPYLVDTNIVERPVVLLKGISRDEDVAKCSARRICQEYVETLTILGDVPSEAVFRPPYYGLEKPMIPLADFDSSILLDLPAPPGAVGLDDALETTKSVWLAYSTGFQRQESTAAHVNFGKPHGTYPGYVAQKINSALMQLSLEGDPVKKEQLALNIAQAGIDYYYIHKNGATPGAPCGAWPNNGGFGINKFAPILIASGLLSKESSWNAVINENLSTPEGRQCFAETGAVQPANPAGRNVPLYGAVTTSVYTVFQSNRSAADPLGVVDGGGNSATTTPGGYQTCCITGPFLGSLTSLQLIPVVKSSIPSNAAHWVEYVQRSRAVGIQEGTEFGAYTSKDPQDFSVTGYKASYDSAVSYILYDAYGGNFDLADKAAPEL